MGLAVGVTPLYGLHLWIVLAVCLPLRLDARLAYLAANVSLPFVAPLIGLAEVQLGSLARSGHTLPITAEAARAHGLGAFARDLAVGTAILAPSLAAVGFGVSLMAAMLWPRRTPLGRAIARAARRYPTRGARIHARAKLASDPIARALAGLGELGAVSDVGCGAGHLSTLLLETGQASSVRGFDPDVSRVALARAAAAGSDAVYEVGDARTHEIAPCDTALVVDVLHYVEPEHHGAIVARAASAARRMVVMRDIDPRHGLRSVFTRAAEAVRRAPHVRPPSELARMLERAGLEVSAAPCDDGTPFSNTLLVARRRS